MLPTPVVVGVVAAYATRTRALVVGLLTIGELSGLILGPATYKWCSQPGIVQWCAT